jgi:hypothetical protein
MKRHVVTLLVILALGVVVRVAYLHVPPIGFHPTRQYRAALIARAESPAAMAPLTAPERDAAVAMRRAQAEIEPEVMEAVASWLYDRIGHEDLRAPRLVSIVAWLLGGLSVVALLRLGGVGWPAALGALVFVCFVPYGVDASRAFMPDPLMVGLTMAALAVSLWHHRTPTMAGLVARAVVAGAAVFIKPMAVFFLGPVLLTLDIARLGLVRGAASAAMTGVIMALPAVMHYARLIAAGNQVADDRVFTQLWTRSTYWFGWLEMLRRVIGWPALALSLLGLALPPRPDARPLRLALASAWVGYVVMGLAFTHHISTHDYYSLPILPIAAASIALAFASMSDSAGLKSRPPKNAAEPGLTVSEPGVFRPRVLALVFAALLLTGVYPSVSVQGFYGDVDAAEQTATDYERIGELTHHSSRVVSLDGAYGYPLSYHARIAASQLPLSIDRAISDLTGRSDEEITADFESRGGEYFAGTLQPQLDAQPNLRALLEQRHVLLDRGGTPEAWRYVVYDLTRVRLSGSPEAFSVFTRVGGGESSATTTVSAPPDVVWRAVSADPTRIRLEPAAGTGDTQVRVFGAPGEAGQEGTVVVALYAEGRDTEPSGQLSVHWRTQGRGPNSPPFGFVDAPAEPVTLGDAPIVFQGWALDDVQLVRVDVVMRDGSGQERVLGQATRAGRRPDVAAAHPTAHDLERSAWSFVLQPGQVAGAATIIVRAVDTEGASAVIGQRTIRR